MKIGIITFTVHNFGAQLQAYALTKVLNNWGYDAEICDVLIEPSSIRLRRKKKVKEYLRGLFSVDCLRTAYRIIRKFFKIKSSINKETGSGFSEFYREYVKKSRQYTADELRHGITEYDCYITGSDQVFNYTMSSILDIYFLSFTNKKKISYAASFGVNNIPWRLKNMYRTYLNGLDFISVRENSGKKIVECLVSKSANLVVDPTFLLNKQQWSNIFDFTIDVPERFIFVYDLIESDYLTNYVYYLSKKINAEIVSAAEKTPQQFIFLIEKSIHVVTTSFHATALSINFGKNFTTIYRKSKEGNSRLIDVCKRYGMEKHLLFEGEKFKIPVMNSQKYTSVLNSDINSSITFLKNSLMEAK